MKRTTLKAVVAALALGSFGISPLLAQDKGTIGISMPTKSSSRWIAAAANPAGRSLESQAATPTRPRWSFRAAKRPR